MCNRIDMRMECFECGYPYSEACEETDWSIPHIKDECPVCPVIQHLNETMPDSLGG